VQAHAFLPCPALSRCLQELRSLTFHNISLDEWHERAGQMTSYNIKPWQQVWVGCPQLTYVKLER
jgi:hypothetical protein